MPGHKLIDDDRLPKIPGGWRNEPVDLVQRTLHMAVPVDPDLLLDLPETLAEHNADDYMPYWAWLWPAATEMAKWVVGREWAAGTATLELGCGLGLVGMTAAAVGLSVTISDYRKEAIAVVESNLRRNRLSATVEQIDWRQPPPRQWPVILSCDVLYELSNHAAILDFAAQALAPGGEWWIGDPGRVNADRFLNTIRNDRRFLATDSNEFPIHAIVVGQFTIIKLSHVPRPDAV